MDYEFYQLLESPQRRTTAMSRNVDRYEETMKTISILSKTLGIMSLVIVFFVSNMYQLFDHMNTILPLIVTFPVVFMLTTEFVNEGLYKMRHIVPVLILAISFFGYHHYQDISKVDIVYKVPQKISQNITPENEKYVTTMRDIESAPLKDYTIGDIVYSVAEVYNIDPLLVIEMVRAESGFTAHAISPKGAIGVMQLMPCIYAGEYNINPFNILENVIVGVKEIRGHYDRYYEIENYEERVKMALSAYNAGPGGVQSAMMAAGTSEYKEVYKYLPQETKNYVSTIWGRYTSSKNSSQLAAHEVGIERMD